MYQKGESVSIGTDKIDGRNIYADEFGFLHDAKAERVTVADCVRAMSAEDLADLWIACAKGIIRVVLGKHGIQFEQENLDEELAKDLILDFLRKDVNEI